MDASAREKASGSGSGLEGAVEQVGQVVSSGLEALKQGLETLKDLEFLKNLKEFSPMLSSLLQFFGVDEEKSDKNNSQSSPERQENSPEIHHQSPESNHEEEFHEESDLEDDELPAVRRSVERARNIVVSSENEPKRIDARSGTRVMKYAPTKAALKIIQEFKTDEPLVETANYKAYNKRIEVKKTVDKALKLANEYARRDGFQISIFSGYRDPQHQGRIKIKDKAKGRDTDKWVAKPGRSWHQSGAAVDKFLHRIGSEERLTPIGSSNIDQYHKKIKDKNGDLVDPMDTLEKYMNMAGFVRYGAEPWHFELGSHGWADIMQQKGYIDSNAPLSQITYKRDQLGEPSHHHHE